MHTLAVRLGLLFACVLLLAALVHAALVHWPLPALLALLRGQLGWAVQPPLPGSLPALGWTLLLALPLLFRQLAQNERSLFAFLCSGEPWSVQDFLRSAPDAAAPPIYRLPHLYAYIQATLGSSLFGRAHGQRWAELAEARRRFRQTVATSGALAAQVTAREADIAQARAQLASAQAEFDKARIDLQRREALAVNGAVSGEELTTARRAHAAARAALATAQAAIAQAASTRTAAAGELAANEALVRGSSEDTDPAVLAAKAKLHAARLDLDRTTIRAPIRLRFCPPTEARRAAGPALFRPGALSATGGVVVAVTRMLQSRGQGRCRRPWRG